MPPELTEPRELTVRFRYVNDEPVMTVAVAQFPIPTLARRVKGCHYGNLIIRLDGRPRLIVHVRCEHISEIGQIFGAPTAHFCHQLYSWYARLKPPQIRTEPLSAEKVDQNGEADIRFLLDPDFIHPLIELLNQQIKERPIV